MSFEIWQDGSDGPALVATASSIPEALAVIAALPQTIPRHDPTQVLHTNDPAQLVFLSAVLDDKALTLVTAWEPQIEAIDGAIGVFERHVTNPA